MYLYDKYKFKLVKDVRSCNSLREDISASVSLFLLFYLLILEVDDQTLEPRNTNITRNGF